MWTFFSLVCSLFLFQSMLRSSGEWRNKVVVTDFASGVLDYWYGGEYWRCLELWCPTNQWCRGRPTANQSKGDNTGFSVIWRQAVLDRPLVTDVIQTTFPISTVSVSVAVDIWCTEGHFCLISWFISAYVRVQSKLDGHREQARRNTVLTHHVNETCSAGHHRGRGDQRVLIESVVLYCATFIL